MPQLLKRAEFNLPYSLTSHLEPAAYLFKRACISIIQTEAHTKNVFFSKGKFVQDLFDLFTTDQVQCGFSRRNGRMRLNKVGELTVVFLSNRCLQAERLKRDTHDFVHALNGNFKFARDLLYRWVSKQLLPQTAGGLY